MRPNDFITVLALAVCSSCASVPMDSTAEVDAVRARSEALAAAEAAMDFTTALTFWAPDAIVQPSGMPQIRGHEAIKDLYGGFTTMQVKSFEGTSSHIEASGDLAFDYGVNRLVLVGESGDMLDVGKYLAVWKKVDGEWMVAALSFTSDAPVPAPVVASAP
ncbi:MAG TPA: DUF4440 domain-containing protein [Gemmatimonadaceae bacterium]|nr:DUF4440 domain-containing protein [Gemmatimonadaceae bacterium]